MFALPISIDREAEGITYQNWSSIALSHPSRSSKPVSRMKLPYTSVGTFRVTHHIIEPCRLGRQALINTFDRCDMTSESLSLARDSPKKSSHRSRDVGCHCLRITCCYSIATSKDTPNDGSEGMLTCIIDLGVYLLISGIRRSRQQ